LLRIFEVSDEPIKPWSGKRLVAMDVNPTHIDLVIVNSDGNLIAAESFKEPALIYARRNKPSCRSKIQTRLSKNECTPACSIRPRQTSTWPTRTPEFRPVEDGCRTNTQESSLGEGLSAKSQASIPEA
jgi:hypothetical protein